MRRMLAVVAAVMVTATGSMIGCGAIADAQPSACTDPDPGGSAIRTLPWAQRWLDPSRIWPVSRGAGQLVAVLDSGVDATNPQLAGTVRPGLDMLSGGDGRTDCVSHGTAVASLIAARQQPAVGFHGLAPDARILPVRISEQDASSGGGQTVPPAAFAAAITGAADAGASVIDVSVVLYADYPQVRNAVLHAQHRGAVVVAAAGDNHRDDGLDPTPYPAAYPGVLGVGAIGVDGARASQSQVGSYVDLVAPGTEVLADTRSHGLRYFSGTSMAAGFVAAAVALVRCAHPRLTAAAVVDRLVATASPAPAGDGYGAGSVNPVSAVTNTMSSSGPVALPRMQPAPADEAAAMATLQRRQHTTDAVAMSLVVGALAVGVLVLAGVMTLGRRSGWHARTAQIPAPDTSEPPQTTSLFD